MLFFNILILTYDNANKLSFNNISPVFREIIFTCKPADVGSGCGRVQAVTSVTTLISRLESVDLSDYRRYFIFFLTNARVSL